MISLKNLFLIIPLGVLLAGCQTVVRETDDAYLNREQLHNLVWEKVNNYYFDSGYNGINWIEAGYEGLKEVQSAKDLDQTYAALKKMVASIKNGHTYVLSPEQYEKLKRSQFVGVGFDTVRHQDQEDLDIVFSCVPGGPADRSGIKPGWIFLSRNSVGYDDKQVGEVHLYRFLDKYGKVHEIELACEELPRIASEWTSHLLEGDVLYLSFDNFDENLDSWIYEQIGKYPDAKGLILDVRWNPGGYKFVLERILSIFLPQNTMLGTAIMRNAKPQKIYSPVLANGHHSDLPMVVLISPFSASSAEILSKVLQHYNRATIIGTGTSAGEVIFSLNWDLPGGGLLRVGMRDYIAPDGQRLEGAGVVPDVELADQSFFEITRGHDPIIERAVQFLHGSRSQ